MKLGGFQETSLLDYPGKICAIMWTVGCNFRCPFCYNPSIVAEKTEVLPVDQIFSFLKKRKGKIDALSITGGEPLLYEDIDEFIEKVKHLGFLVKLDTNGSFPERLQQLLDAYLIDYVSMDVKAPPEKYNTLAGVTVNVDSIDRSIKLIMKQAPDYEFKTTVVPGLLDKKDIDRIASWIKGAKRYYLQQVKLNNPVINQNVLLSVNTFARSDFEEMKQHVSPFVQECIIRGM